MRRFTLLAIIGFLIGCASIAKAESTTLNTITTISLLDLTDRDTTVNKTNPENEEEGTSDVEEEVVEDVIEEAEPIEIVIQLSPKQEETFREETKPSDDEIGVMEIGVIMPSTRYNQPSEETEETMVRKIDEETGEEYFIRKSYAPSEFQKLQNKRKYKRRANRLEAKGMKSST